MRSVMPRTMLALTAVLAGIGFQTTGALAAGDNSAADNSVLRIGWAQDPSTLNPYTAIDIYSFAIWNLNWDQPIGFRPQDNRPTPGVGLVDRFQVSPDRKTIVYKMPKGLQWSDGKPVTSRDFKFTMDTLAKTGFNFASYGSNVTSVEAPNATTVVIHTRVPDVRLTDDLLPYVLPAHIWARVPTSQRLGTYQPTLPLVGTGPFIVDQFSRGHIVQLARNPHFRGPRPGFSKIQYIKYGTDDAVQRALRSGEVDAASGLSPTSYRSLEGAGGITVHSGLYSQFTMLGFNLCPVSICPDSTANPALHDVQVRRALAYAVDRPRITEIAARGTSTPATGGIVPPFYRTWYTKPATTYSYDPARAKKILAADGWRPGSDGILTKGPLRLKFRLNVRTSNTYDREAAQLIAEEAKAVGIQIDVNQMSQAQLFDLLYVTQGGKPAPDFDIYLADWQGDPYDPSFLLSLPTSQEIGFASDTYYVNPHYDALYASQLSEFNHARRKAIIAQMVDVTQRELPYVVLSYDPLLEGYRTGAVNGLNPSYPKPDGGILSTYGYLTLAGASPGTGGGSSGGSTLLWVAVGAAVVLGVGGVARARRRRKDQQTELET